MLKLHKSLRPFKIHAQNCLKCQLCARKGEFHEKGNSLLRADERDSSYRTKFFYYFFFESKQSRIQSQN